MWENTRQIIVINNFTNCLNNDLNISGALGEVFIWINKVFKELDENNISSNGKETYLTFTIKTEDLNKTKKIIQENKIINYRKLLFEKGVSKISVIGVGMITTPGVTFRMFQTLANRKINIKVISTSEIKISVLIDKKNTKKALIALHKEFNLDKKR